MHGHQRLGKLQAEAGAGAIVVPRQAAFDMAEAFERARNILGRWQSLSHHRGGAGCGVRELFQLDQAPRQKIVVIHITVFAALHQVADDVVIEQARFKKTVGKLVKIPIQAVIASETPVRIENGDALIEVLDYGAEGMRPVGAHGLGLMAFDGEAGNQDKLANFINGLRCSPVCLGKIKDQSAEDRVGLVEDRHGPTGMKGKIDGEVAMIFPQRVVGDIRDGDGFAAVEGRSGRSRRGAYAQSVNGIGKFLR